MLITIMRRISDFSRTCKVVNRRYKIKSIYSFIFKILNVKFFIKTKGKNCHLKIK